MHKAALRNCQHTTEGHFHPPLCQQPEATQAGQPYHLGSRHHPTDRLRGRIHPGGVLVPTPGELNPHNTLYIHHATRSQPTQTLGEVLVPPQGRDHPPSARTFSATHG